MGWGLIGHLLIGYWVGEGVWQLPSPCGVGGETGYTAQEDPKSINSYNMAGRTIRAWFFLPAFQDPPYLLFHPWVTTDNIPILFKAPSTLYKWPVLLCILVIFLG